MSNQVQNYRAEFDSADFDYALLLSDNSGLFNTKKNKKRGTEEFFHHPYVNGEVAHYLVEQGVRFIGIDTINADQTGGTEFPVHDLFSEKRLMIGENWAYFDRIDFENPYIIAIPMKVVGCDGSPVRAIAVEWED